MLTVFNKRRVFAADFQKDRPNLFKLVKNTIQFPNPLQTFCFLWSSFQTVPEEYDKEALFLIRQENEAFQKRSLNRRNLKTLALRFRVDGKHFENGAFFENDDVTIITWFLCPSFSQTKIQILRRSVEETILMHFQRERPPFSNFSGVVCTGPEFSRLQKLLTW